jgi:tetratricopeptide (TPR) repeat protein
VWSRSWLALALAALAGCAPASRRLDPEVRWRAAERRRDRALRSLEAARRLRSDYEAVTRLARDGGLRARAFLRLAEIDLALGRHRAACENLENALLAGPAAKTQRTVLLALGDVLCRQLAQHDQGTRAYEQIITEYPGSPEAKLAKLRLEALPHER